MMPRPLAAGVGLALVVLGCDAGAPPADGKRVSFDTVCDKDNLGKRVALEGFLDFPNRFNAKAATIVMRFQAAPTRSSRAIGARVKLNAGTNTIVAPPDKYNETDLKAITHDGKSAGYRTRIKLTGTMRLVDSLETRDFQCILTDTRIEIAGMVPTK